MFPTPEITDEISRCSKPLREYIEKLHEKIECLTQENEALRARINQNSNNSSKPPSSNPFVKSKSLRVKTGRKPGGQPGHKGCTLRVTETPDVIVEHNVDFCDHCKTDISAESGIGYTSRQVVDVVITRVVTEHRSEKKICPECGEETTAVFPQGVDHYIQYGNTFSSIIIYLNKGHFIPYDRLSKISKEVFNVPVSSGTLVNIIHKCGNSLESSMEYIKDQLKQSRVVHFDETGTRINGKNQWLHTAGNDWFTYVETHEKRGSVATDDIGILPEFEGIAVHDFWKSYFNYTHCDHSLCNAHILRELNGITENFKQTWSEQMKTLLVEIKKSVDAAGGLLKAEEATAFEVRYDEILCLGDTENPNDKDILPQKNKRGRVARSKARNLLDRMKLYKKDILKFMTDSQVPFDNNLALC